MKLTDAQLTALLKAMTKSYVPVTVAGQRTAERLLNLGLLELAGPRAVLPVGPFAITERGRVERGNEMAERKRRTQEFNRGLEEHMACEAKRTECRAGDGTGRER